jgi:hypothetical protein
MKTNEQILKEVTALMADTWLAACERRVISWALGGKRYVVLDARENVLLFGPASADECQKFVHRSAAYDVLRAIGTTPVADAALMVVNGSKAPVLSG